MRHSRSPLEIAGDGQRGAAADAPAFDRHDRDCVDLFPRLAHLGSCAQANASFGQALVLLPRAGRVLEVRAEREVAEIAGQDHGRDVRAGMETPRRFGELTQGLGRQRIGLVATVKANGRDAARCFDSDVCFAQSRASSTAPRYAFSGRRRPLA